MPTALDAPSRVYPLSGDSPPMSIFSYSSKDFANPSLRAKRRQVKNACTSCQRACKKCDDARPCLRCVKYGIGDMCVDSQRKERKKGVKRGPYKKRDGKASNADAHTGPPLDPSTASPEPGHQYQPLAYGQAYLAPYQPQDRPQEPTGVLYSPPQYYIAPMPALQEAVDFHSQAYYQPPIYHTPPYMMHRPQLPYTVYPSSVPQKLGPNDMLSPQGH